MRYSASRLKAWQECSLKAHYRYDEGLPSRQSAKASFGTIIHHALQTLNDTGDYHLARNEFKVNWARPENLGVEPDYWPKFTNFAGLKTRGLDILESFENKQRFQKRTVLGTEIGFLVPFGNYELTGYVDCLEIMRSGNGSELLKVVDYKSNSRNPNMSELALDIQFTVYMYAVGQREFWVGNGEFPGLENGEWLWSTCGSVMKRRAIWYALWTNREIDAGPRTQTDFERLYRVCDEINRADELGVHVPHIGEACEWCDYVEPCAMEVSVAITAINDKSDPTRWV